MGVGIWSQPPDLWVMPCVDLQSCIVTHESNGIDIITALILNDISPLCKYRMDLVLQLKVDGQLGKWRQCIGREFLQGNLLHM